MTQQELADILGITQGTVSRWLNGTHFPTGLAKKALKEKFPELYERLEKSYERRHTNSK